MRLARRELLAIGIIAVIVIGLLADCPVYRRQHWSCALCRLTRNDYAGLGHRWSEFEETECSKWYHVQVAPVHEHAWFRSPPMQEQSLFRVPVAVSDSDRPAGPLALAPAKQLEMYSRIPDPIESQRLFLGKRDDLESGDHARWKRVRSTSIILSDWAEGGFVESWHAVKRRIQTL